MGAFYRIVEWSTYQHYKDRDPPWIKLHRDTLTSRTWVDADDKARVLAVACMLIAAGTDNQIPADPGFVRRRAYLAYDPDFSALVDLGFIELVSDTKDLASPVQADASATQANGTKRPSESESEGEAEKSREEQKDNSTAAKPGAERQRGTRLTDGWQLTPELRAFASDLGLEPDGLRDEFVDYWTSVPGSKGLKLDWEKTFKNRCRELGKKPTAQRETFDQRRIREAKEAIRQ